MTKTYRNGCGVTTEVFGTTTLTIDEQMRCVTTRFMDGTRVFACPEDNEEYRARAESLGYVGEDPTWQMCKEHERTHSQLAHALGMKASPALWHVAHPEEDYDARLVDFEEGIVLLLQSRGWTKHTDVQPSSNGDRDK